MKADKIQFKKGKGDLNKQSLEEKIGYCQRWQRSMLSKKEFCKQHGFSVKTLGNWIKLLGNKQVPTEKPVLPFVALSVEESVQMEKQAVTIQFYNGLTCCFERVNNIACIVRLIEEL